MTTVLYVTTKYSDKSGGGKFSNTILKGLESLENVRVINYEIDTAESFLSRLVNAFRGYIYGITRNKENELVSICKRENVNVLFASYTYYGTLCRNLKRRIPGLKIVSLAQNVEYTYHKQLLTLSHGWNLQGVLFIFSVWLNEKRQLRVSDFILGLNTRDSNELFRLYGRRPDDLLGIILPDEFKDLSSAMCQPSEKFALFVGSRFPPNEFAVRWIATNIAPKSPIQIMVVGKGFEDLKDELSNVPNLTIVGTVDSLAPYYQQSQFVISPIFHGSGMKVKTAEALMYGKRIIASKEALEGYDVSDVPDVIHCQTPKEFIDAINDSTTCPLFSTGNREAYLKAHTPEVLKKKLSAALA